MKIGLYIFSLAFGGAERVVSRLSSILETHGHSVYVILDDLSNVQYEHSGTLLSIGIPHNTHGLKNIKNIFDRSKKLQKYKLQYQFDVVISFLFLPNIVNILSKTKDCKTFVSIRNHFLSHKYDSISSFVSHVLAKKYYKKADGVISVSELVRQDAIKHLHIPENKSFVLYNPYDIEEINSISKNDLPGNLDIDKKNDKETFTFVTTGRHFRQKGFWHLIKSFYLLSKEVDNVRLVLIGDGEQREKIELLIEELDLKEKVILTGFQKNVFAIEKHCNVYVMTSLFEGFPNALVEAMCLGLPVISTDCKSGPREILAPNTSISETAKSIEKANYGILVPPLENDENWMADNITKSEKQLADAMKLIMNKELFAYYSSQSKKRAADFSFGSCYAAINNILKKKEYYG